MNEPEPAKESLIECIFRYCFYFVVFILFDVIIAGILSIPIEKFFDLLPPHMGIILLFIFVAAIYVSFPYWSEFLSPRL